MFSALQMQSYGGYVWSCYGLTAVALIYLVVSVHGSWRNEIKHARRRLEAADQSRNPS